MPEREPHVCPQCLGNLDFYKAQPKDRRRHCDICHGAGRVSAERWEELTGSPPLPDCPHLRFNCTCNIDRIADLGEFAANLSISCMDCGREFRFLGMEAGVDRMIPKCSLDATTAILPILPEGEVLSEMEGTPRGFSARRVDKDRWGEIEMELLGLDKEKDRERIEELLAEAGSILRERVLGSLKEAGAKEVM